MCCKIFGVCHKHNSLPLEPIQPSSPTSTKELHDLGHIRVIVPVANLDLIVPNNNSFLGGSPGLAVIGGYSHSEGRGFESQYEYVSLANVFCCFLSMALIFVPKVLFIRQHAHDPREKEDDERENAEQEQRYKDILRENEALQKRIAEVS